MDDDDREWLRLATAPREPRNENDRRLIEFGHDPWLVEWFLTLSVTERIAHTDGMALLFGAAKRHARSRS